jgi:hypothetical protein
MVQGDRPQKAPPQPTLISPSASDLAPAILDSGACRREVRHLGSCEGRELIRFEVFLPNLSRPRPRVLAMAHESGSTDECHQESRRCVENW